MCLFINNLQNKFERSNKMVYGECETYGKRFVFPKLFKKGYVELHNNIDLSIDSHEEEM